MEDVVFSQIDFGLLIPLLENEDVTDISYSNGGQLWVKTLSRGVYAEHVEGLNNEVITMKFLSCDLIGTFFLLYLYSKKDKLIFVLPFLGLSFLIADTNIYKVEFMNIDEYNYLYNIL